MYKNLSSKILHAITIFKIMVALIPKSIHLTLSYKKKKKILKPVL